MHLKAVHWGAALVFAVAIHVGAVLLLGWLPAPGGVTAPGSRGIEVSLGLTAGSPGAVGVSGGPLDEHEVVEPQEMAVAQRLSGIVAAELPLRTIVSNLPVETGANVVAEPHETTATPPAAVEPDHKDAVPVDADTVPSSTLRSVDVARESVDEVAVGDQARPSDDTIPEVRAEDMPPEAESPIEVRRTVEANEPTDASYAEPVRDLEPVDAGPEPAEVADAAPESTNDKQTEVRPVEAAPVQGGPGGGGYGGNVERGEGAAGQVGVDADYNLLLREWLERHKRYPRRAMRARQQGTVFLYFEMDRAGNVVDYRLRESSGHPLLDEEVEKMIRRAQPLPRFPDSLDENRLAFVIPIEFSLR